MSSLSDILKFFEPKEERKQDQVTPSFAQVFKNALQANSQELRVAMPAEVIKYDHKQQMIDAKPDFKRKYNDGALSDPPIIYNVPVAFPRAGGAGLFLPLSEGDKVLLVFADRSLDKWLTNGNRDEPGDTRTHHISDAIAYPGCYPFSDTIDLPNAEDVFLKHENCEIRMKKNGHIQVLNETDELLKILYDWISADLMGAHPFKFVIRERLKTFLEK